MVRQLARIAIAGLALLPFAALPAERTTLPATVDTDGGMFRLTLQPSSTPVPVNELFELTVNVTLLRPAEDTNPLWLGVEATMPGHGHGMNTQARIEGPQQNRFTIRGLLLHMTGEWEFSFDVAKGRTHEKATVRFVLE